MSRKLEKRRVERRKEDGVHVAQGRKNSDLLHANSWSSSSFFEPQAIVAGNPSRTIQ